MKDKTARTLDHPRMKLPFIWRDHKARVPPNSWTYFRREFAWHGKQATTIAFAADPTARLWINGQLVLARVRRFVTPQISVQTVELRDFLKPGRNVAVILHHHWGRPTFQRSPGGQPGVAIAGDVLSSKDEWKWQAAPEIIWHPHQTLGLDGNYRIRFPVAVDLRLSAAGLHAPGMPTRGWRNCRRVVRAAWSRPVPLDLPPLIHASVSPKQLVASGDFFASSKTKPLGPASASWRLKHGTYRRNDRRVGDAAVKPDAGFELSGGRAAGYATFDFGRPVHGYVALEIEAFEPGVVLDFGYGEIRDSARTGERVLQPDGSFDPEIIMGGPSGDRVILKAGTNVLEIPEERTMRWLLLVWSGNRHALRVRRLMANESGHPVNLQGSFRATGVREIAPLVRLCLDHARVTMSDTYVDTPSREDAQWLEDIEYRAELAARWFGDTGLRQLTLRHAVEQQAASGCFRAFAPDCYAGKEGLQAVDWGMTWIGLLHDDWRWTGERGRLEEYFPALERFIGYCRRLTGADGLLRGGFCFNDIRVSATARPERGECHGIANAWLHGYLTKAAAIAAAIGRRREATAWRQHAGRIRRSFQCFVIQSRSAAPRIAELASRRPVQNRFTQAAAISAIHHGVLPVNLARAVLNEALPDPAGVPPADIAPWNNPTYAYRVLATLSEFDRGPRASRHFLARYRPYLPDGPLPEYFLPGERQPVDPTGSHGWAAVPLLWLHEYVLGVRLRSPGGAELHWKPTRTEWSRVAGATVTPRGVCAVEIDWRAGRATIRGPRGVVCRAEFPGTVVDLNLAPTGTEVRFR